MKRVLPWIVVGAMWCAVLEARAQDASPWQLGGRIAKLPFDYDKDAPETPPDSPLKFLHVWVDFQPGLADRKSHQFRITDATGKETFATAGARYENLPGLPSSSRLVFEADEAIWRELRGKYLDGLGLRVPLVQEEPPPKPKPVQKAEKPPKTKRPPAPPGPKAPRPKPGPKPPAGVAVGAAVARAACCGTGGAGGGAGGGGGACTGCTGARTVTTIVPPVVIPPRMALYLSCGEEPGTGRVHQVVATTGERVGVAQLPHVATGLAFHRTGWLVAVMPRDGGQLVRIDDRGRYSTFLWKDSLLRHPVDVGIPAGSDVVVVADDIAHVLAATDIVGDPPRVFRRFELPPTDQPTMSVAVTPDLHVLYGTSKEPGVYRFPPVNPGAARTPLLPNPGGVAADGHSLNTQKWAATQGPDEIVVFEGGRELKRMRLPPDTRLYGDGLLAFDLAGRVVVAAERIGRPAGEVGFYRSETTADEFPREPLFWWTTERLVDFVAGPFMPYWPKDVRPIRKPIR